LWEQLQQSTSHGTENANANSSTTYGDLTKNIVTITTVQDFWRYFMHLPQPSQILGESKKIVRQDSVDGPTHNLAALMFFKENIRPEWEDPANRKGGHFQFTLQLDRSRPQKEGLPPTTKEGGSAWLAQADEYWNNIVLGLIGGGLDSTDFVTGIRLVDKVKLPGKAGGRPVGHIRIEVWFREASDQAKISALKEALETHMKCRMDGTVGADMFNGYRLDMRSHEETSHNHEEKKQGGKKPQAKRESNDQAVE
jgi:translation initiation factor 4E